jgi:hypothetical protein
MLSHMGLAEGGLWATTVNDGRDVVLVIKLSTDALKWIHRGISVNMLIGHVKVDNLLIRVVGLEVFDCREAPLILSLPQVEDWEVKRFDDLLGNGKFPVYFHNEQPFVSVLDAIGSLPQESVEAYVKKRDKLQFYTAPVATAVFRKAQDAFDEASGNDRKESVPHVNIFRFPLSIANPIWNSVVVPDAGSFSPDNPNEGQSHEALLLHVVKPNFDGSVLASPQISDGSKTRELCDVLAVGKDAFLFEAKAFAVFDKPSDQSTERKAATVMKHFEKALGQLQGAVKRLEKGIEILGSGLSDGRITGSQFRALHGIVVVSNTSFELPWLEIGKQLAEAQRAPRIYYHFLPLAEIQRMVAFAKGSSQALNLMLKRRGDIIASSKDARIQTDYKPEVPSLLHLPPVKGDSLGLRFVWIGENVADWLRSLFPLVYQQLFQRAFSGRLDFYHKIGKLGGVPAIGIGLAAHSTSETLGPEWWSHFHHDLFQSLNQAGLPPPAANSVQVQTLREITTKLTDLLLAVEFRAGFVVAKKAGEEI